MAEKEQRILITTRHKDEKLNMTFTDIYKEYTRQEAIERMEKAVFSLAGSISNLKTKEYNATKCTAHWIAEAALNALLGDK